MFKQILTLFFALIISISCDYEDNADQSYQTSFFTADQRRFQKEMLDAHNRYRVRHCASPLSIDDSLSQRAQSKAEQLARSNGLVQPTSGSAGQNLFVKTSSFPIEYVDGNEATTSWYNGRQTYDYGRGGFSYETGTFTQLVWASSERLGVGISFTSDGRSAYIVALYDPPGNFNNDYQQNVFPVAC